MNNLPQSGEDRRPKCSGKEKGLWASQAGPWEVSRQNIRSGMRSEETEAQPKGLVQEGADREVLPAASPPFIMPPFHE